MTINIKKVKLNSFSQEVNKTFMSGDTIVFLGKATITEARFLDNQDGTHNATYIAKPELVDIRLSDVNENTSIVDIHKIKEKSESQALRQKAFIVAQQLGLSEQGLYSEAISKGHEYLDSMLDQR